MTVPASELAGIVAARICHDLGSPLGAVENALEMMADATAMAGDGGVTLDTTEEQRILASSAGRASAILRLERLAFGRTPDAGSGLARRELRAWTDAVLGGPRVELRWSGLDGAPLPRRVARAVALMAFCARGALRLRGRIAVVLPAVGALPVSVVAEGERAALSPEQEAWMTGGAAALPEPQEVEYLLLDLALRDAGARLALRSGEGSVVLNAAPAG